ncbi:GNAT family N-acetyltransferase [Kribbella sindirgiensis]|uniref:GNAT family N-acetyltransferase n=1 Tax=Kribbella sindirgiensis TaxID=1124744 RepID=A0A4R0J335_9ACTN|nr:GNAT family N-acetyltransferase [Kribbella sindirgiensis]TCC39504.1 GNAT family N-acetyltransferase [Kribbella sindirgiensis]
MSLDAWIHGWTISRGTPAPVKVRSGYRVDVGLPGHQVRYVLPTYDAGLVDGLGEPDTWLKICGQVSLGVPWQVQPVEYLMSRPLASAGASVAASYELTSVRRDSVVDVVVRAADGSVAARGKAALTGEAAVFDQIETSPQHRRRGLGRSVMAALSAAAQYAGANTGVLVATEDGRALYTALGWTLESPMTAAVSRG